MLLVVNLAFVLYALSPAAGRAGFLQGLRGTPDFVGAGDIDV